MKINTFIVNYKEKDLEILRKVREDAFDKEVDHASTMTRVYSLAVADWKIEIDAIAVVLKD